MLITEKYPNEEFTREFTPEEAIQAGIERGLSPEKSEQVTSYWISKLQKRGGKLVREDGCEMRLLDGPEIMWILADWPPQETGGVSPVFATTYEKFVSVLVRRGAKLEDITLKVGDKEVRGLKVDERTCLVLHGEKGMDALMNILMVHKQVHG